MTRRNALSTKIRTLAVGLAAIAVGLTGLAGAAANASAAGKAPTKVLIVAESGGFHGFVKSPKLRCMDERTVVVFQQLGSKQRPASDPRVAMDTTEANGDGYEWDLGNPGLHSGRYYARAVATPFCRAANSVTMNAQE